jgi:hypothetical protein
MEWLLCFPLKDQALDGAPALALGPFPSSRQPSEPSLAPQTVKPLASYCSSPAPDHPAVLPIVSPEPHRSTLDPDRGYYGEAPGRLRWGYGDERAVGDANPPIPLNTAKNHTFVRKCLNRSRFRDPHGDYTGPAPGCRRGNAGGSREGHLTRRRVEAAEVVQRQWVRRFGNQVQLIVQESFKNC